MSQEMKIKIEPTEVDEHFSCEKKIKLEDIDLNQSQFDEKAAEKKAKKAARRKRNKLARKNRLCSFFVRNLSSEVTEEKLKSLFSAYGDVTEVKIFNIEHDNLTMSGCAFIKYATNEEALNARRELEGKLFLEKNQSFLICQQKYQKKICKKMTTNPKRRKSN